MNFTDCPTGPPYQCAAICVDIENPEYILDEGSSTSVCIEFVGQLQRDVFVDSWFEDLSNILRGTFVIYSFYTFPIHFISKRMFSGCHSVYQ